VDISSDVEMTLYRVIQEALNNVAKHSGATRVGLVLSRTAHDVQAIIEDNGRGFDPSNSVAAVSPNGQLGLLGIQERLAMLGGTLKVESAPARGATLIVRIPIAKTDEKKEKTN
jgi:two-component system, chemotaxis family, sensor kinase Cph1